MATNKKFEVWPSQLAKCIELTGGKVPAGVLLYRLACRAQKGWLMKHPKDGKRYAVLTRNQWMTDTGLTRHQHDGAIKALKEKKLVEVRHSKRNKLERFLRTWARPTDEAMSVITEKTTRPKDSENSESPPLADSENAENITHQDSAIPDDKKITILPTGEENKKIDNDDNTEALVATPVGGINPKEECKGDKGINQLGTGDLATCAPPPTSTQLEAAWNESLHAISRAPMDFTDQKGQANSLNLMKVHTYWNTAGVTSPENLLNTVVTDWEPFTAYVRCQKGAGFDTPGHPTPGWLAAFKSLAIDWYRTTLLKECPPGVGTEMNLAELEASATASSNTGQDVWKKMMDY